MLRGWKEGNRAKLDEGTGKVHGLKEVVAPVENSIKEANGGITAAEERVAELKGEKEETVPSASPETPASPEASTSPEASPEAAPETTETPEALTSPEASP